MSFRDFFTAQILRDDEGKKEVRPLLGAVLIVTILVIPIVLVSRILDTMKLNTTDIALILLFFSLCYYYYLLKKGKLITVSLFYIITAWIAITIMAGYSGGIRDITIIGYFLLILLSTFLTGYRFAIILALLSLASFWTMAIAEYKNIFVPFRDPPLIYARDFTIFIFLGGTISAESLPGEGSVFAFSVPVVFLQDKIISLHPESDFSSDRKLNILIAEDDEINTIFLREIFRNKNCTLLFAKNGVEAVDLYRKHTEIDVVLMDLKMPEMNGYEAAKIIKGINQHTLVIALTAFALEEDKKRASSEHFDDYIVKPFDRKNLMVRIEKLVHTNQNQSI